MSKKLIIVFTFLICAFLGFSFCYAASASNLIDVQSFNSIYKMSEESDITLPFLRLFNQSATFDKSVNKSGISISSKTLEVDEHMSGVHAILSRDTVNIKGTMEYGIIIGTNVVISGNIEKDILIIAESIFITDTATIGGDIITMAGSVELKGTVKGNFIANSEDLLMQGNVNKDFRVSSEKLKVDNFEVGGNIYIETNSKVDITEKYPNAIIKSIPTESLVQEKESLPEIIRDIIIGTVLFALLNLLVVKIRPNVFNNLANKFKDNTTYSIIMAVVGLITIPIIITLLIILSVFGLATITMPALLVYITILVIIVTLAKFITGSVLYEFCKDKLKVNSKLKQFGVMMGIYAMLYILCKLPVVGEFITIATVFFSAAFVITGLTKKSIVKEK